MVLYFTCNLPPGAKPRIKAYLLGPGILLYGNAVSHSASTLTQPPIYNLRKSKIKSIETLLSRMHLPLTQPVNIAAEHFSKMLMIYDCAKNSIEIDSFFCLDKFTIKQPAVWRVYNLKLKYVLLWVWNSRTIDVVILVHSKLISIWLFRFKE